MIARLLLLLLFLLPLTLPAQREVVHHRARIFYQHADQLTDLAARGVPVDHGRHRPGYSLESDFSAAELAAVRRAGLRYEVLIEDVGQFYRDRNDPTSDHYLPAPVAKDLSCGSEDSGPPPVPVPEHYQDGSMGGFLTYDELLAELDEMYAFSEARGLNLITPRADNIDPRDSASLRTFEGRYQQWVRISDNADGRALELPEPQILYTALHHAREPASLQQLVFFMWYLLENYETDPNVRALLDGTELYFLPCVNPDGYVYNETTNPNGGGFWRKNRWNGIGVDNNRNYDYITPAGASVWCDEGASPDPGSDVYCGTAPFSEPENRGVRYFAETHDFRVALNNHTSGELLLYPFGYTRNARTPDDALFRLLAAAYVEFNDYADLLSSELYPAAGDSDDFLYGMLTGPAGEARPPVFAMTPEIGTSFWPARSEIADINQEMLPFNLRAARSVGTLGVLRLTAPDIGEELNYTFTYAITRVGFQPATYRVDLLPVSNNIETVTLPAFFPNLAQGEMGTTTGGLRLANHIRPGDEVVFDVVLSDGAFRDTTRVVRRYGAFRPVVTTDFSDDRDWTSADWGLTTEDHAPGSPDRSMTDSPGGRYDDNVTSYLTLDTLLDLTAPDLLAARLTFRARWEIEADYDYVQLQLSTDGGQTWTPRCGRYTRRGVATHGAASGQPLYDGTRAEWVREEIDLADYLGQTLRLRFHFYSDAGVRRDGFYLDDLAVSTLAAGPPVATGEAVFGMPVTVYPTPAAGRLHVRTTLRNYTARLLSLTGRPLRRLSSGSGDRSLNLSGLPAGIYLLELRQNGRRLLRRVVVR